MFLPASVFVSMLLNLYIFRVEAFHHLRVTQMGNPGSSFSIGIAFHPGFEKQNDSSFPHFIYHLSVYQFIFLNKWLYIAVLVLCKPQSDAFSYQLLEESAVLILIFTDEQVEAQTGGITERGHPAGKWWRWSLTPECMLWTIQLCYLFWPACSQSPQLIHLSAFSCCPSLTA